MHRPTLAAFDRARETLGGPTRVNSGHRCALHNAAIGGAPRSCHLRLALDVATREHGPLATLDALVGAGFTGLGYYETFVHADLGRTRTWFGSPAARAFWAPLLAARSSAA